MSSELQIQKYGKHLRCCCLLGVLIKTIIDVENFRLVCNAMQWNSDE